MRAMHPKRYVNRALLYYGVLTFAYLLLSLVLPVNHNTEHAFHLSDLQYHVLILLIILPLTLIWLVAFYGYSAIRDYATLVEDTEEGDALRNVSTGLMWLAWGLPIPAIIGVIMSGIANAHPSFYGASVIINNYATLLFAVIAFHVLSTGSRLWTERANLRISLGWTKMLVLIFVIIGAFYCFFVFRNIGSLKHDQSNPYYLGSWWLLVTVVVPYLYAWFVGFLAAFEISMISRNMKGLLYRQALQLVSRGLVTIVFSSIALQFFRITVPTTGKISLGVLLLIIYLLVFIIGLGYATLTLGARKLKKIEEV
jgi:hypothetical protein